MLRPEEDAEHRLAVLTNWGFWGGFAIALVASGFAADSVVVSLAGYGLLVAGFVSHVIVNWVYGTGFRNGEVTAAFGLFGVAVVTFLLSWLLNPLFSRADVVSGLAGLAIVVFGFIVYLTTRFGLRGSFSMFHIQQRQ
jgi:hypothetical protein